MLLASGGLDCHWLFCNPTKEEATHSELPLHTQNPIIHY